MVAIGAHFKERLARSYQSGRGVIFLDQFLIDELVSRAHAAVRVIREEAIHTELEKTLDFAFQVAQFSWSGAALKVFRQEAVLRAEGPAVDDQARGVGILHEAGRRT